MRRWQLRHPRPSTRGQSQRPPSSWKVRVRVRVCVRVRVRVCVRVRVRMPRLAKGAAGVRPRRERRAVRWRQSVEYSSAQRC